MKLIRFFLIAGGALLMVFGIHETLVARHWKGEGQEVACKALAESGPGANVHIRLVDFRLGTQDALHEETKEGAWRRVWIPAYPAAEAESPGFDPTAFRVLVRSDRVRTAAELEALATAEAIEGMVVNEVETVTGHSLQQLEDRYPHAQIDRCWILDHGRRPMSTVSAEVLVFGGLVLLGLGVWLATGGRRKRGEPLDVALRS